MNTSHYMVRLTPLGSYFFGGEITFGEEGKQNYYVMSSLLPQVSSLIGLMRYEILRQNNLLSYNKDSETLSKVKGLIGEKSFSIDNTSIESYGIIKKISPVFIECKKEKAFYTPKPLDYGIDIKLSDDIECSFSSSCLQKQGVIMNGYDPKEYNTYQYWINGKLKDKNVEEIFYKDEQIGITKNGRNENESDAFFKIISAGLRKEYNFAFKLETFQEINEVTDEIVFLGGNRSAFMMNIEKTETNDTYFEDYFKALHKDGRFLLLSDTYFTDKERDSFPFIWGTSLNNRYIITESQNGHNWKRPQKSDLFHLFARGGIVYTDVKPEAAPYLNNVGLNIFI